MAMHHGKIIKMMIGDIDVTESMRDMTIKIIIELSKCKCGRQPKRGMTEKKQYRVVCVKMDGGCSATTINCHTQDQADTLWNNGDIVRK